MRINHTNRFLMTEADGSPGGGAAPASPAEPPAEPAAPAPAPVTVDQVKSLMAETLNGFKNAMFADMRKAGVLGKEKPAEPSSTPSPSAVAPASTGLTEADLETRLEQERVITKAQVENKLTDAQVKRMKSALRAEKPDDVSTWTTSYLADLGLVRTEPATPTPPTVPAVPNAAPISDRGSPAPNGAVGWKYELSNPMGMSSAARAQMDAELGAEKARKMRLEAAQAQAARMQVVINPRG
jgi:hypothetical protein